MNIETQYLNILRTLSTKGILKPDRTGTGTRSVFGLSLSHRCSDGFPLLTTKRVFFRGVIEELLMFIAGITDPKHLQDKDIHIWDEWESAPYGRQWRNFGGVDQLADAVAALKTNPHSRRILVSAWNPPELGEGLPPCHMFFQFWCDMSNGLYLQMYQRSADWFLGVPFNIASYAALLHIVANEVGMTPMAVKYNFGDSHVYNNHTEQVKTQLARTPKELPKLTLTGDDWERHKFEDFTLDGYDPYPGIKAPVAV